MIKLWKHWYTNEANKKRDLIIDMPSKRSNTQGTVEGEEEMMGQYLATFDDVGWQSINGHFIWERWGGGKCWVWEYHRYLGALIGHSHGLLDFLWYKNYLFFIPLLDLVCQGLIMGQNSIDDEYKWPRLFFYVIFKK